MRSWVLGLCMGMSLGTVGAAGCGDGAPTDPPTPGDPGPGPVVLPQLGTPKEPGDPGAADVRLSARTDGTLRAISPMRAKSITRE